jgi:hypothetical protein
VGYGLLILAGWGSPVEIHGSVPTFVHSGSPIVRDRVTADPAPLIVGDTRNLYVGQDEAEGVVM